MQYATNHHQLCSQQGGAAAYAQAALARVCKKCQPMAQCKESVLLQHLPVQRLTSYCAKGKHGHRCHVGRGGVRGTSTSGSSRGNGSSRMAHGSDEKTIKLTFNEKNDKNMETSKYNNTICESMTDFLRVDILNVRIELLNDIKRWFILEQAGLDNDDKEAKQILDYVVSLQLLIDDLGDIRHAVINSKNIVRNNEKGKE